MNDVKKVSVLLPLFKGAQGLADTIESVLQQGYQNLELLIGDDGSDDASSEIARQYSQSKECVFYWRNSYKLGLFANYNTCLARATGEFIKPMDQDDVLAVGAIENLVAALEKNPTAVLASGARRLINHKADRVENDQPMSAGGIVSGVEAISHYFQTFHNNIGVPSQVLFRRRDKGEGFEASFAHAGDIDFWLRLLDGGDLVYVSEVVVHSRRDGESLSLPALHDLSIMADAFGLVDRHSGRVPRLGKPQATVYYPAIDELVKRVSGALKSGEISIADLTATKIDSSFVLSSFVRTSNYDYRKMAEEMLLYATAIKAESDEAIESKTKKIVDCERQIEEWSRRTAELSAELTSMKKSRAWKWTALFRKLREVVAP